MGPLTNSEETRRKEIMSWAQKQKGALVRDGNSVSAGRLFLANSVIIWSLKQLRDEKLKENEAQGYFFFVKKHVH